jgi:hypothetical protein
MTVTGTKQNEQTWPKNEPAAREGMLGVMVSPKSE